MDTSMTIEELMAAKEGENIQFKEAKKRSDFGEAIQCCCALSNCGGGKLVFGITDKRPRQVVGGNAFDQPERTRKGVMDKLKIMVDFQLYGYRGSKGPPFKELQQVLPGHSRGQIQTLLRELRAENRIYCAGNTSVAKWFAPNAL